MKAEVECNKTLMIDGLCLTEVKDYHSQVYASFKTKQ